VRGALPASGMLSRWSRGIPNAHNAHMDNQLGAGNTSHLVVQAHLDRATILLDWERTWRRRSAAGQIGMDAAGGRATAAVAVVQSMNKPQRTCVEPV